MIRLISIGLMLLCPTIGHSKELSAAQVRELFSAKGANPGAVFQLGEMGRYVLKSLVVTSGKRGEFIVKVQVEPLN